MSTTPRSRNIRRHLIAGLIVIAPITITAAVLWWIFQALDGLLGRFVYAQLGELIGGGREAFVIPGLGLLLLFLLLVTVGWAAERAIGSRVVTWWHATLERIPLTRRIYSAANRIVRTVFGEDTRPFKTVVLIEYPADGRYAIGFLAAAAPALIQEQVPGAVTVFMPTTPNPTTGFLVILEPHRVVPLRMSIDQAFTYILSAGAVRPEELAATGPGVGHPAPADVPPASTSVPATAATAPTTAATAPTTAATAPVAHYHSEAERPPRTRQAGG